jgi:hypothetical protein
MSNYTLSNFRHLASASVEELKKISFPDVDVLIQSEDLRVRLTNIEKAIALNTSELSTTALILKASDGQLLKLETQVSGFDGLSVFTKEGLKIPLVCIYSIDFY